MAVRSGSAPYHTESVTAAGSTQADATPIPIKSSPALILSTGNLIVGIKLPPATEGKEFTVKNLGNNGGFGKLNVYPSTDDAINALAVNAALVMDDLSSAIFRAADNTTWYTIPTVPS